MIAFGTVVQNMSGTDNKTAKSNRKVEARRRADVAHDDVLPVRNVVADDVSVVGVAENATDHASLDLVVEDVDAPVRDKVDVVHGYLRSAESHRCNPTRKYWFLGRLKNSDR